MTNAKCYSCILLNMYYKYYVLRLLMLNAICFILRDIYYFWIKNTCKSSMDEKLSISKSFQLHYFLLLHKFFFIDSVPVWKKNIFWYIISWHLLLRSFLDCFHIFLSFKALLWNLHKSHLDFFLIFIYDDFLVFLFYHHAIPLQNICALHKVLYSNLSYFQF